MNTGKFLLSTIAYGVINTAIAVVYHENIFGSYYHPFNIYSGGDDPNIPLAAVGGAIVGYINRNLSK